MVERGGRRTVDYKCNETVYDSNIENRCICFDTPVKKGPE